MKLLVLFLLEHIMKFRHIVTSHLFYKYIGSCCKLQQVYSTGNEEEFSDYFNNPIIEGLMGILCRRKFVCFTPGNI